MLFRSLHVNEHSGMGADASICGFYSSALLKARMNVKTHTKVKLNRGNANARRKSCVTM